MEGYTMEGRQVTVFYDDGGTVSRKDGTFLFEKDNWVHLKLYEGKEIALAHSRIIRIELKGEETE